jgi:predicted nucleic acid-binding protein
MKFADLPDGTSLFIDANTFVYHFQPHPVFGSACTELLDRVETGHVSGFTSTHILSEVTHRLMTIEASILFNWPFAGIAHRLRNHPAEIQKLSRFRQGVQEIPNYNVQVLTISPVLVDAAAAISQQHGLLSNDARIVALMREQGLVNLASHDADFDRVTGLTRLSPA